MTRSHPVIAVLADEEDFYDLYEAILSREGYTVYSILTGHHTADIPVRNEPDLLIIDLVDSSPNNIELLRKLGNDIRLRQVPVMVSTDNPEVLDLLELPNTREAPVKPFEVEEFISAVRNALAFSPWLD